jgi:hypothetical protein
MFVYKSVGGAAMDERFVLHNAQLIQIGRRFPLNFGCGSAALRLGAFALNSNCIVTAKP